MKYNKNYTELLAERQACEARHLRALEKIKAEYETEKKQAWDTYWGLMKEAEKKKKAAEQNVTQGG